MNIPIKVTSKEYEIILSGVAHLSEPEITFEIANLKIKYEFISDKGAARFEGVHGVNELTIKLYNSGNSLGEGKLEPVEIGTLSGKRLFATWFVNTIDTNIRQFLYTFLLKEA